MKTKNMPITVIGQMAVTLILSACGKTTRSSSSAAGMTPPPTGSFTSTYTDTSTYTYTNTSTNTSTSTNTGTQPPLSFEFSLKGNQVAQTPAITTDNVLKVKFRVTAEQGNHVWKASELKVTIAMNGTEVTPTYTGNNYTYGQVGETSNVIDLSNYISQGQSVQITVKAPKYDFYCTYWGGYNADGSWVNPQYNSYPGCRKEVFHNHNWSGVLIVQTSSTTGI